MDLSHRTTSDAIIVLQLGVIREVVSYLCDKATADVNVWNGRLSPIHAAVKWQQVDTCRQLLDLKASIPEDPVAPSLLHLAAAGGSFEMAQLLLLRGAKANASCKMALLRDGSPDYHWPSSDWDWKPRTVEISPLHLAIHLKHWGHRIPSHQIRSSCQWKRSFRSGGGRAFAVGRAASRNGR